MDLTEPNALAAYAADNLKGVRNVIALKTAGWCVGVLVLGVLWAVKGPVGIGGLGSTAENVFTGGVLALVLTFCVLSFRNWVSADPKRAALPRVLRDEPEKVVWYYPVDHYRGGAKAGTDVWIRLEDGSAHVIAYCARDALMEGLRVRCPRATAGYSQELEAAFAQDPKSLRAS